MSGSEPNPGACLRFAIVSDPHALAGNLRRQETHARRETAADPVRNPFAAVRRLIEQSADTVSR